MEGAGAGVAAVEEERRGVVKELRPASTRNSLAFDPRVLQRTDRLPQLLGSSSHLLIITGTLSLSVIGLCPTAFFSWLFLLISILTASACLYWTFYFLALEDRVETTHLDSLLFFLHWTGLVLDLSIGSAALTFLVTLLVLRAFANWSPDSVCSGSSKQWSLLLSLSLIRRIGSLFISQSVVHFLGLTGLLLGHILTLKIISNATNESALRTRKNEVYAFPKAGLEEVKLESQLPSILLIAPEEPVPVRVSPGPLCSRQVSHPPGPPRVTTADRNKMRRTSLPAALPLTMQRPNLHHVSPSITPCFFSLFIFCIFTLYIIY